MEESPLETPEKFDFPFEPYKIQHDFMSSLYRAIEGKKLGIFESPTGTGKSLSIICGALKWLKDNQNRERSTFENKIISLECEKSRISSEDTSDWLNTQSEEIEITRKINTFKLQQNKIIDYDKKIENITKNKQQYKKKKFPTKQTIAETKTNDKSEEVTPDDNDIIIDDPEETEDDSRESDDDSQKYKAVKIFICSRTHSQLSQFITEIHKSPYANDIRVVSLASRQTYCINHDVTKLKSSSMINEKCLDMQKSGSSKTASDGKVVKKSKNNQSKCPFYKQNTIEDLRNVALSHVEDIEDLISDAKTLKACPYYATRLAVEDAELVLVPYNTILHKSTREANGIDLANNIVIIDEAHNLIEALAQMHNCEVSLKQIEECLRQVKCYKQRFHTRFSPVNLLHINQILFVLGKLNNFLDKTNPAVFTLSNFQQTAQIDNYNMFNLVKFCKDTRLAQKLRGYALKYPFDAEEKNVKKPKNAGMKQFLSSIQSKSTDDKIEPEVVIEQNSNLSTGNPLLSVIALLEALTYSCDDGRIIIHDCEETSRRKIQFLLLNPAGNFAEVVKQARSVIVAGGTMKPNSEFKQRLFINSGASPERIMEFSCDHIVPSSNILPIIVTHGLNNEKLVFNYENRNAMGANVKVIIQELCQIVPGGIVVFFPSYKYENFIWQQMKDLKLNRMVFREPQDSSQVPNVLKKYAEAVSKVGSAGALLLSVVGGKLSEGLNFSDDLGRCIVVVGLPYSNITALDLKEKMSYLDKTEGMGSGKRFYENSCMKAVNQSIGRAVRHKNDYATILLLDDRYNRANVKNALPDWIKRSLKCGSFTEARSGIKTFFGNKKAQ